MKTIDENLDQIESKLDQISVHLNSIDVTLAKQSVILDEHVHRTELAEESIELLRADLKPVQKHIAMIQGGMKVIAIAWVAASVLVEIWKFFQ